MLPSPDVSLSKSAAGACMWAVEGPEPRAVPDVEGLRSAERVRRLVTLGDQAVDLRVETVELCEQLAEVGVGGFDP